LTVLVDGSELLPYVIFNHKTKSKEQMHSGITGVLLTTQVKATAEATISFININLVVIPGG
jgi:hypothetical protein